MLQPIKLYLKVQRLLRKAIFEKKDYYLYSDHEMVLLLLDFILLLLTVPATNDSIRLNFLHILAKRVASTHSEYDF